MLGHDNSTIFKLVLHFVVSKYNSLNIIFRNSNSFFVIGSFKVFLVSVFTFHSCIRFKIINFS